MNTQHGTQERIESRFAIIAAILVLFTAMLDPRVSASISVMLLIAFAVYKFVEGRRDQPEA